MIKSNKVNRKKFDIWMDKEDIVALDFYAKEKGMTRSAASRYIIMDYLKDKDTTQQKNKIDPQFEEVREAVTALNNSPYMPPDVELPDNVDPVIAEGVRNTVIENMKHMGLYTDEYKDFIERAIKLDIKSLMENDDKYTKACINYYHEKASLRGEE